MAQYCPLLEGLTGDELRANSNGSFEALRAYLRQLSAAAYRQKRDAVESLEPGLMQEAQRFFVLTQTDNLWKEHLQAIKFLQQAVGLRGYAARDPLTEFKLEGYNLFLETTAQVGRFERGRGGGGVSSGGRGGAAGDGRGSGGLAVALKERSPATPPNSSSILTASTTQLLPHHHIHHDMT